MGVISGIFRTLLYSTTVACLSALGSFLYQYKKKLKLLEPWEPVGRVGKLYVYPLKSGKKIEVQEAECTEVGLRVTDCRGYKLRDRWADLLIRYCYVIDWLLKANVMNNFDNYNWFMQKQKENHFCCLVHTTVFSSFKEVVDIKTNVVYFFLYCWRISYDSAMAKSISYM